MYEYIIGKISECTPTYVVVDCNGIGYLIHISLNTYSEISNKSECKIFLHHVVREDAELLYGFFHPKERDVFRLLVTVSGVGSNTARMILSSMTPGDVQRCIMNGDVATLQSVKGIGAKTAQRVIVDLKDKVAKTDDASQLFSLSDNKVKEEALTALIMLGFSKKPAEGAVERILSGNENLTIEELIKKALKIL